MIRRCWLSTPADCLHQALKEDTGTASSSCSLAALHSFERLFASVVVLYCCAQLITSEPAPVIASDPAEGAHLTAFAPV